MQHWKIILSLVTIPAFAQNPARFTPVTDQMLENPDPGDWLMWRRTLNSWGYSPLNQIDRANVSGLQWSGNATWGRVSRKPRRWSTKA
jgi:glucose dehydrogenase